jgi:uncharacterized protein (DUF3820 family)
MPNNLLNIWRKKMTEINTHGLTIDFGKHKGELFTRLPRSYIRWMINEKCPNWEIAKAEFERRGDTMPKVELSGHAIDNASLRVISIWQTRMSLHEGFYSWLQRMTLEAIEHGEPMGDQIHWYKGMKFCIAEGEEFPTLKTIMRNKAND